MEILVTLVVVALVILIFFIVQTLLKMQTTLKNLDFVLMETERNLRKLSSFMSTLENLSDITEKESERLKHKYEQEKEKKLQKESIDSEELAAWLISSMKLGVNYFTKR